MKNRNFECRNKRNKWYLNAVSFAVSAAVLAVTPARMTEGVSEPEEPSTSAENIMQLSHAEQTMQTTTTTKATTTSTTTTTTTTESTTTTTTTTTEPVQTTEPVTEPEYVEAEEDYYWEDDGCIVYDIPNWDGYCHSETKTFMGYQAVTMTSSPQYQLLNSAYAFTDEHGLRMYDDGTGARYCVAVGSYYTTTIGQKFDLVMEDGHYVPCILGDAKADIHTNWSNQYGSAHGDVVEFIIDNTVYYQVYDLSGTVNWVDGLSGKIQSIVLY